MASDDEIILFHYAESIYSHRVIWYLKLAGIPYSECIQPPIMPRPDLARLGVSYRRIPILSIGEHVYCDSRLILQVLQDRYPLAGVDMRSSDAGVQKLFQFWNVDQVFMKAASCLPFERSAFARDPAFLADRAEATGNAFQMEDLIKARPESYSYIRSSFDLLETFLEDGREWISGGRSPTATDIEAIYTAQWLIADPVMKGAIPEEFLSEKLFPKTYAWVYRFEKVIRNVGVEAPKPVTLHGSEAFERITKASSTPDQGGIQGPDPLGLEIGQKVEIWPTDWASNHHDSGELVMLMMNEVCIRNAQNILVHYPRWNFRMQAIEKTVQESTSVQTEKPGPVHQLIYHPMSPYSRKVYMFALELGLQDRIKLQKVVVAPVKYPGWSDDNNTVARSNPLAKIPTLVLEDTEDGIYDSRIICEFLEEEASASQRSVPNVRYWRLKTLHACADGMLDAQVSIVYENKIRAENNVKYEPWITGQQEKIMRGFDRLEFEAGRCTLEPPVNDASASAAEVAVAACVGFMDIVGVEWREGRSRLAEWFQQWQQRESFIKTRPDVDWKTGEKADIGFAREALAGQKG